jgi:hypothetical protein
MKRFWPLAFLVLLFGALALRPTPELRHPAPILVHSIPQPIDEPPVPVVAPAPIENSVERPDPEPAPERHEDAMKRSAVGASILWLAKHQNEDGSWGDLPATVGGRAIGRTGVTSLALLTLLGAGYSHLSKDEYDGDKSMGRLITKTLKWFLQDQRDDGTFRSGYDPGFDQVLATLALSEAYGMTASEPLKEPAQRAVEAMARMQGSDGSWGSSEITAWAIQALFSAQLSEIPAPGEAHDRALEYVDRTSHPGNLLSRILLTRKREGLAADAELLAGSFPSADGDFAALFHASHGLFSYSGSDGDLWKKWSEPMKNAILPLQGSNGSWQGGTQSHTVVRTSLAGLTLQVYYRYANIYGSTAR